MSASSLNCHKLPYSSTCMTEHCAILGINMASIFGGIFLIWDNGGNQYSQWHGVLWDCIYISILYRVLL